MPFLRMLVLTALACGFAACLNLEYVSRSQLAHNDQTCLADGHTGCQAAGIAYQAGTLGITRDLKKAAERFATVCHPPSVVEGCEMLVGLGLGAMKDMPALAIDV